MTILHHLCAHTLAGRILYMHLNLLRHMQGLYGNDELAAKEAGHQLRGLISLAGGIARVQRSEDPRHYTSFESNTGLFPGPMYCRLSPRARASVPVDVFDRLQRVSTCGHESLARMPRYIGLRLVRWRSHGRRRMHSRGCGSHVHFLSPHIQLRCDEKIIPVVKVYA